MPAPARSRRIWMVLAFVAGIVFAAAVLQTLATAKTVFPIPAGDYDSMTPGTVPADGHPVGQSTCALVYDCPGIEAIIFIS